MIGRISRNLATRLAVLAVFFLSSGWTFAAEVAAEPATLDQKIDPANWQVLTGTEDGVLELAVALGIQYSRLPNGIDYSHSYLIATLAPDGTVVHKWTIPSEGPEPSVAALHKALANREDKPQPQPAKNAE
jgi:hypothetical protein